MENNKKLWISEVSIAKYLHTGLLAKGYVPDSDEILDIAEIMFDYLIDCQVFEYVEDDLEGEEE